MGIPFPIKYTPPPTLLFILDVNPWVRADVNHEIGIRRVSRLGK